MDLWKGLRAVGLVTAGTLIGTGLGYVTVIAPRRAELVRRAETSPFLRDFDPIPALEPLAAGRVALLHTDVETDGIHNIVQAKTFHITVDAPGEGLDALADAWTNAMKAALDQAATETRLSNSSTTSLGRWQRSLRLKYEGAFRGCIRVEGFGTAEQITIQMTVHDHH